jgi:PAS domain S-box-containing protein
MLLNHASASVETESENLSTHAPVGILILSGPEYTVEFASEGFLPIIQRSSAGLKGKKLADAVAASSYKGLKEILDNVSLTGRSFTVAEEPALVQGNKFSETSYLNIACHPYPDAAIGKIMLVMVDVTVQVLASKKVKQSDERLSLALESSQMGMFDYDIQNNNVFRSLRHDQIFGYDAMVEKWSKETLMEHIHREDVPLVEEAFTRAYGSGKFNFEARVVWPDSSIRWIKGAGQMYYDVERKPARIMGTLTDITEQKQAQLDLYYRNALLEAQSETIPDGVVVVGSTGRVLSYNRKFADMWGIPLEILIHQDDSAALEFVRNKLIDPDAFINRVREVYEQGTKPAHDVLHFKDGRIFERLGSPVLGQDGLRYGWLWHFRDVTDQRKAEEKLRIQAYTLSNLSDAIIFTDTQSNILSFNKDAERLYGWKEAEVLGLYAGGVIPTTYSHPAGREERRASIGREGSWKGEVLQKRKDGSEVYVLSSTSVVKEETGKAIGYVHLNHDITARKKIEEELYRNKNRLQNILESISDGFVSFDKSLNFVYFNKKAAAFAKINPEQVIGQHILTAFPKVKDSETYQKIQECLNSQMPVSWEYYSSVAERWIEARAYPTLEGLSIFSTDITSRRSAEDALKESEEKFRTLVETLPQLVWISDPFGSFEFAGNNWKNFFTSDVLTADEWKSVIHPDDREAASSVWNTSLQTGKTYRAELRLKDTSGEYHWHYLHGEPLRNEAGIILKWVGAFTNIQDIKKAEEELRKNESQFRQIADSLPQLVWTSRPDGYLDYYNKRWYEYTGFEESYGHSSWIPLLHPDDVEGCLDTWHEAIRTGGPYQIQYRFKDRKSGTYRWFLGKASPLRDEDGTILKWFGTCTDIHDQKLAEESLQLQARVLESMDEGVSVYDEEGFIVYTNPAEDKIFGYEPGELIGKNVMVQNAYPRSKNRQIVSNVIDELKTKGSWKGERHNIRKDGTRFRTYSYITLLNAGAKNLFISVQRDITEERKVLETLRESEERFRNLADQSPMFVWMADEEVNVVYCNKVCLDYMGFGHYTEFLGQRWESIVHPDDRDHVYKVYGEAFEKQTAYALECRFKEAETGEYNWFMFKGVPRFQDKIFRGFIGTAINIQKQKTLMEELEKRVEERTSQLKEANRLLTASNKELEQFAYVASHDLQEPLRKTQTFIGLIAQTDHSLNERTQLYLQKIHNSSERMMNLVKDLLSHSNIDARHSFTAVDLNEVLANISTDLELVIIQKRAIIRNEALPVIDAIPLQMHQLFFNLINNALKFSKPTGSPVITISCEQLREDQLEKFPALRKNTRYHLMKFRDNGIGFNQVYATKIFDIFQRLHDRQVFQGSGIGLALCKKIIENHGGVIYAESRENEGACFYLILPVKQITALP